MSALAAKDDVAEKAAADSEEEFVEIPESEKTPVTIITGFLGEWKVHFFCYIISILS